MARYDRLAPLPLPPRTSGFVSWNALRDLAERERDVDLARRLRLHFLALRPLLRRARAGDGELAAGSLASQVERVREELGALSARDPQRSAFGELLSALVDPSRAVAARAALAIADRAIVWGHASAAEEYARAALALARAEASPELEAAALAAAARCAAGAGRPHDAARIAADTAAAAEAAGNAEAWAQAMSSAARYCADAGDAHTANDYVARLEARGEAEADDRVRAMAAEAAATITLASGGAAESAAEQAWHGLSLARSLPLRIRLTELLGDALAAAGRTDAADHALQLAARAAEGPERLRLTARRARLRAEDGDDEGYRALSRSVPGVAMTPAARLELARGAVAIGDLDVARRHLTAAQQSARAALQRDASRAAAMLAAEIDGGDGAVVRVRVHTGPIAAAAARIAEHVLSVGTLDAQS